MKTSTTRFCLASLLGFGAAGVLLAATPVTASVSPADQTAKRVEAGAGIIPAGRKLTMTFTDIDLAGEYEPWRGGQWSDVRIIKDIYSPRFVFSYKLTDAAGAVLKEDKVDLRDLTFMMRVTISRNEPLRFEKDILADWIRSVVPRKK